MTNTSIDSISVATTRAYLKPIDEDGLAVFAQKGRSNPTSRGTNKVHTVMQGMYRSLSFVGDHSPVVVDEPLHLFGENTAPAPTLLAVAYTAARPRTMPAVAPLRKEPITPVGT